MKPFDKLSKLDKRVYEEYVKRYGYYLHKDNNFVNVNNALSTWNFEKQYLFDLFGQELILEKEIDAGFANEVIAREIASQQENHMFSILLRQKLNIVDYYKITKSSDLAINKYTGETFKIKCKDKEITVHHGCKLNKLYNTLTKAFGLNELAYYNYSNFLSSIINQNGVKGTLCLSIHPLDYLTLSDNCCDWSSCLSWMDNQCFSIGPIAAMNDAFVVVAYIKSKTDMEIGGGYEWNSKKWRQLYLVDQDLICGFKAYPFDNKKLDAACLDWLYELICQKHPEAKNLLVFDEITNSRCQEAEVNIHMRYLYNDYERYSHNCYIVPHRHFGFNICNLLKILIMIII